MMRKEWAARNSGKRWATLNGVWYRMSAGHLTGSGSEIMANEQKFFATSRGLGPHASRRGFLQTGLAIGTLALGERAALGQSGGGHAHMPELGVANLPVVPVMDQPASLRATRVACAGVILSATDVTRRNVWLGNRSSAVPSGSTRIRYAEPRWLPSVITVTPALPSTGKPALPPVRSMTTTYGPLGAVSFETVGRGVVGEGARPGWRSGAVVWTITGGTGRLAGARGLITSNFAVNDEGDVVDHHVTRLQLP